MRSSKTAMTTYYRITGADNVTSTGYFIVPEGNYSRINLNAAIVAELNVGRHGVFLSDPDRSTNSNEIANTPTTGGSFEILTDAQLAGAGFDATNPRSINNALRNFTPKINTHNDPYISGYIDLFPIRNVYIIAHGLGNFNTMSISGERAIVKKVPVTSGYGEIVHDQNVVGIDYLDCSKLTLSRLGFQVKDVFGRIIDLNGQHRPFSMVFSRISEIM